MKGRKIGNYQLESTIGEGSFGKVYLARYQHEQYALKCISKRNRSSLEIRNLKTETDLLTKVKHNNIIMLKECLETDTEIVVVMEYAGSDLSELLRTSQKFNEDRIRMYARQILNAMLYLKDNRIMHRDLKPQNILLQKEEIKICDFGFAKQMSASTQFLRSIKGTPLYIAPEILLHNPYTDKVDVWSFGVILYELFTGKPPFYAKTIPQLQPKILHDPVKFPTEMSPHLRDLIDGMLQKHPSKRFQWQQVQKHPFFVNYPDLQPEAIPVPDNMKKREREPGMEWNVEEQCAYLSKCEFDFKEGKVTIKELRYSEQFCLRVTTFFGQSCISREKVPQDLLLALIKLVTKLSMQKSETSEPQRDLAKNKDIFAAIVALGLQETVEEFLEAELELIGFLLKQNFDGLKIDTDLDSDITKLIAKRLDTKQSGNATVLSLKVLGILTSQAIMTLSESQEYFERIAEQKIVTRVAECYFAIPETHTVLECLQKFLHPRIERSGHLSHKTKAVFTQLKEEAAAVLLAKDFIKDEPLTKRKWNRSTELEHYCEILYECLSVSEEMRLQFLKYTYWEQLLSSKKTRLYFLGYAFLVLRCNGKVILSNEMLQNQTVEGSENKLGNVFLLYFAYHKLKNHPLSKTKIEKIKILFSNIQDRLAIDQEIKKKHCFEFQGSLSENGCLFDDILVSILSSIALDNKHQEVTNKLKGLLDHALRLPLSEDSLISVLELAKTTELKIEEPQVKKLTEYFAECIKTAAFDDLLSVHPEKCKTLIQELLNIQYDSFADEKEVNAFAELIEKYQFLRVLFSQQLTGADLVFSSLRIVNKIIYRIKSIDFLVHTALKRVKKHYDTNNEDFIYEIILFCSNIARMNQEASKAVNESGVVALCQKGLAEGSEQIKEKTLHLIGNLSKYSKLSFDSFEQHGILAAISKCLATHKDNPKILKNTIYAIGNISYYSDRFAKDIKPMIKFLAYGLVPEDDHLLTNTLSTISNLLRHGRTHLQTLIDTEILAKVVDLYSRARTSDQVNFFINLIKKAVAFPEFLVEFQKKKLKNILESHLTTGLVSSQNQNAKKLRQLLS